MGAFFFGEPHLAQAVIIRQFSEHDIGAVTAIQAEAVSSGYGRFAYEPADESEMLRRISRLKDGGYPCLVAELGSEIAGFCFAGPYRPRPGYRWTVENSVYVSPELQGVGIGKQLLDKLISVCTELGYRQMITVIGDSANTGSIKLHEACGFVANGTLKDVGYKHGRWLDVVIMQLTLGEGSKTKPGMKA